MAVGSLAPKVLMIYYDDLMNSEYKILVRIVAMIDYNLHNQPA